jgi:pimeloyl-ACP methyl ester carboxylesterase
MTPILAAKGRASGPGWHRPCRTALLCLLLTALHGCAWFDVKQREWALRPTPGRPADADSPGRFQPGDERFLLPAPAAPGEQVAMWWLPHADAQAPTLLYLHGTLRTLYGNQSKIDALRAAGFSVLAVDYRGWGESTPIVPSEDSINADAQLAFAELKRRQPDARKRVIFGHSMGGAVAVTLASGLHHGSDYGALALESTFDRIADVAAAAGFWGRVGAALTTLKFDSAAKIGRVDAPIFMLHGSADKTVPVALGRRLRDAAPPGTHWTEVPGGSHSRLHSDAPDIYLQVFHDLQSSLKTPS